LTSSTTGTFYSAQEIADAASYFASQGRTVADILSLAETEFGLNSQDVSVMARAAGIQGFADGTNYVPNDMLALIHKGEAIVPRAYNPAADGDLTTEIRGLREELACFVMRLAPLRLTLAKLPNYKIIGMFEVLQLRPTLISL